MYKLIIESVFLGFFFLTFFSGVLEVVVRITNDDRVKIEPYIWVVPSILLAAFWFTHNLQLTHN